MVKGKGPTEISIDVLKAKTFKYLFIHKKTFRSFFSAAAVQSKESLSIISIMIHFCIFGRKDGCIFLLVAESKRNYTHTLFS